MPRYENDGFNPQQRRNVDRTVPENENFYGVNPVDLNFNSRQNPVRNNQVQYGINPCDGFDVRVNNQRVNTQSQSNYNPDSRRPPQKKSKKKKKNNLPKLIAVLLAFVIVITGIAGTGTIISVVNKINYHDKKENTYVDSSALYSDANVKNILLLGVDARSGQSGEETRSDTMMLVTIDKNSNTIKLTSFLRDTWVYIPTLGYEQRLNAACSSGGYQGVVDAIEYNFKIAVDGYAVVDFEMFKVLVDSLGGVEVDVTEAEANEVTNHPNVYGDVVLNSGKYKLTGEQALAYCRIRKIDTDFVRTERQRTVMSAILSDIKGANPIKLINMAKSSAQYIETDLSKSEIASLATSAVSCLKGDMKQEKVPFDDTWSYATIRGNSVISINLEENQQLLKEYIYEK